METNIEKVSNQEKEIDLIDLVGKLWMKRKFVFKISLVGALIGVFIAFSIPKEYSTIVILAPEVNSTSAVGSAGALAAMAGINLGGTSTDGDMAPELYPNIVASTPFIIGLFDVGVRDLREGIDTSLYSYIKDKQKKTWWSKIISLPNGIVGLFLTKNSTSGSDVINPLVLTRTEIDVFNDLKNRIMITVDKKTGVITLSSIMQSPEISACIADTLTSYLQSYIINYRTQKARQDLSSTEKLYTEAKKDYYEAQQKYAKYLDENQNVILASYRVNQEKLQNEVALTYSVYNQMAQQLQLAKIKVQDKTPVYTIIQPAIVPLIPIKPNKKLVIIGFAFFAIIGACGYVLLKNYFEIN